MSANLAVIITCHAPYLRFLPEALESIDRQASGGLERVVVFDGCAPAPDMPDHWASVTGSWRHPSAARNAGISATTAPWLIFVDADNAASDGYLAGMHRAIANAPPEVAIIFPDIQYCDEFLRPRSLWQMPQWDYWELRRQNCVDTSSAWRREALEVAGGWAVAEYHEDYILALAITASGWKAAHLDGPPILMREHGDGRRADLRQGDGGLLTHIWRARSLGIVSLLAGRSSTLDGWTRFLLTAELPPTTALYVVDNSNDRSFTRRVREAAELIASKRSLSHLDIAVVGQPYKLDFREPYLTKRRHLHIAQLYARALPRITEDLVLTLEDDIEPPPHAVRALGTEIGYPARANVGVIAAAYASPETPSRVCAGLGPEPWGRSLSWSELPTEPIDVSCVGGGCSMWGNWALRGCVPHVQWDLKLGWDGVVCTALRRNGYRVRLHGGVRCHHRTHGRAHDVPQRAPAPVVSPRAAPPRTAGRRG